MHLPVELCEQLLRICHQEGVTVSDGFAHIFKDLQNSRLRQLFLYDSPLTDRGLRSLLVHGLRTIVLFNCQNLTGDALECINEWSDNLVTLSIVNTVELEQHQQVFPPFLDSDYPDDDEFTDDEREEREENKYQKRRYILRAPRLRSLTVRDLCVVQGRDYFHLLCKALPNLTNLDLSGVVHSQGGLHGLRYNYICGLGPPGAVMNRPDYSDCFSSDLHLHQVSLELPTAGLLGVAQCERGEGGSAQPHSAPPS